MARKTKGSNPWGETYFASIKLDVKDKAKISKLFEEAHWGLEIIDDVVSEGFKLSFNRDDKNNTFTCALSITTNLEKTKLITILMGRGASPIHAFYSCMYKHLVLSEGHWTSQQAEAAEYDEFD